MHVSGAGSAKGAGAHYQRGHQRRQSVAHLLPDISKLRLLSWLVEASSELIDCDIAIMDGVYAKLNRSRESLLFWQQHQQQAAGSSRPAPAPPPPSSQPVANNRFMVAQQQQQHHSKQLAGASRPTRTKLQLGADPRKHHHHQLDGADLLTVHGGARSARTHHSLPPSNCDAASLAAVSWRSSKTMPADSNSTTAAGGGHKSIKSDHHHQQQQRRRGNNSSRPLEHWDRQLRGSLAGNRLSVPETPSTSKMSSLPVELLCDSRSNSARPSIISESDKTSAMEQADNTELDYCDSNQSDDELNSSAASSSTTSSGIHRASLSSSASSSSSSSSASSSSVGSFCSNDGPAGKTSAKRSTRSAVDNQSTNSSCINNTHLSSAERLSERIRQCVMRHNYLQSLLVNMIRQHDRQRDLYHQRQLHKQQQQGKLNSGGGSTGTLSFRMPQIDLTDIADSLNDGCQCFCHQAHCQQTNSLSSSINKHQLLTRASAATPTSSSLDLFQPQSLPLSVNETPSSKSAGTRRLYKIRHRGGAANKLSREDIIQQMSDKLCDSCFETHYWLHACYSLESSSPAKQSSSKHRNSENSPSLSLAGGHQTTELPSEQRSDDQNALVSLRNATFIRLVQQQVRSTISKSIELIDLIRKEIKSPESIKQKQLMKCFSSSIQLLSSVANYVVPSQDISSFIPEIEQHQQAILFNLPPQDFDHLLMTRPSTSFQTPAASTIPQPTTNYHLATVPEIPPRRRFNQNKQFPSATKPDDASNRRASSEQLLSSSLEKLRTNDATGGSVTSTTTTSTTKDDQANTASIAADSSSGASSNNSSASSSIARGQVQQSSLTRAHTSSAILDGKTSASHDHISYNSFASLTRQQTEDDILYHQSLRPKFWQSSKFNFIKKLLHVRQQRLLRQQSKDRRIYNNKVQNKFRLVMMDLTHFNKSQQLLTTENGVNSLLTSMRNVLEFGLYLTVKLY